MRCCVLCPVCFYCVLEGLLCFNTLTILLNTYSGEVPCSTSSRYICSKASFMVTSCLSCEICKTCHTLVSHSIRYNKQPQSLSYLPSQTTKNHRDTGVTDPALIYITSKKGPHLFQHPTHSHYQIVVPR